METTLHVDDYKFIIQENKEITKIDQRISSNKIYEKLMATEFPSVVLLLRLK